MQETEDKIDNKSGLRNIDSGSSRNSNNQKFNNIDD